MGPKGGLPWLGKYIRVSLIVEACLKTLAHFASLSLFFHTFSHFFFSFVVQHQMVMKCSVSAQLLRFGN